MPLYWGRLIMYFHPQEYDCPKCKSTFKWSVHHDHIGFGIPFCINCYKDFLKDNIPIGELKK